MALKVVGALARGGLGLSLALSSPLAASLTVVSSKNVILASQSPYIVSDDLLVLEEGGLEIQGGTRLLVADGKTISVRGSFQITGNGYVTIAPLNNAWQRLEFVGAPQPELTNLYVTGALEGVVLNNSPVSLVEGNVFVDNGLALFAVASPLPLIARNVFRGNTNSIRIWRLTSDSELRGNYIAETVGVAIEVYLGWHTDVLNNVALSNGYGVVAK